MSQNNLNNKNNFLKISTGIVILLLGLIVFLIFKISPQTQQKTITDQTSEIISDINKNSVATDPNNKTSELPNTSLSQLVEDSKTIVNTTIQNQNNTTDTTPSETTNSNEKIVVAADETKSTLNSYVKKILVSGEASLSIPKNYIDYSETVDYNELESQMKNPLLIINDRKYSESYLNEYVFIRDEKGLRFTSQNVAFLDSFQYKNKVYWVTLVQGIGGVGKIILSEPKFVNKLEISDFKDDLILSLSKKESSQTNYIVEVSSGNGIKSSVTKYELDFSKIIDGGNSALVK